MDILFLHSPFYDRVARLTRIEQYSVESSVVLLKGTSTGATSLIHMAGWSSLTLWSSGWSFSQLGLNVSPRLHTHTRQQISSARRKTFPDGHIEYKSALRDDAVHAINHPRHMVSTRMIDCLKLCVIQRHTLLPLRTAAVSVKRCHVVGGSAGAFPWWKSKQPTGPDEVQMQPGSVPGSSGTSAAGPPLWFQNFLRSRAHSP